MESADKQTHDNDQGVVDGWEPGYECVADGGHEDTQTAHPFGAETVGKSAQELGRGITVEIGGQDNTLHRFAPLVGALC